MAEIVIKLVNGELAGKTAQSLSKEYGNAAQAVKKAEIGTKAWVDAHKKLDEVKGQLDDLKKQTTGLSAASDTLKNAWNKLPGAQYFNQIGQSFGMMKQGVGGLISQFGMLKTAIASTGIGLLVLAISSLISYFTQTQEGIDKITTVTRPLNAMFKALTKLLSDLGGKIFKELGEAIENPKQALIDLGDIILNNVINRFKAFALIGPAIKKIFSGDFAEGFKDLGNAAIQATTGIENGIDKMTDAANKLKKILTDAIESGTKEDTLKKSIERQEVNQIKRLKELELLLKQQKDIVEDGTKGWDERRDAAAKALSIQQSMLNDELSMLDKRIELMKIQHSQGSVTIDQEKEMAELIAKRLELDAKTIEQSIAWKKKITEFDKAQAAEQLAIVKNIEDLKQQVIREGMDKDIAAIELSTERKIEALIGSAEQILEQEKLIEEIRQQEIQAIKDRYAAEAAEKDTKAKEDQKARDEKLAEDQKKIADEKAKFEQDMLSLQLDIASESFGFIGELSARQMKDEKAAKKIRKAMAITDIGINLTKELSANALAAAANPLNAVTFGAAGAAQLVALNTKSIIFAGINAAKVLAFKKGGVPGIEPGVLTGPSHENGGIPLVAEGEEIILTKGVYRNPRLRSVASALNVMGGGRSFAAGGVPSNPMDRSRGSVPTNREPSFSLNTERLELLLTNQTEAINARFDRLKVQNIATETKGVLDDIKRIQNEAHV